VVQHPLDANSITYNIAEYETYKYNDRCSTLCGSYLNLKC
jgi:hypothetical protein